MNAPENIHDARSAFVSALKFATDSARDNIALPYDYTPAGLRLADFRRVCPPEFMQRINPELILNRAAFAKVASWDGSYPGPLAIGTTSNGKTRAAWSCLGRLWVRENKSFRWVSARRLTEDYFEHHMAGELQGFWRALARFNLLFVDDLDKLEISDRNAGMIFEFVDWLYREKRPVITTSNRGRSWWEQRMGVPFCRRFFDEIHHCVQF